MLFSVWRFVCFFLVYSILGLLGGVFGFFGGERAFGFGRCFLFGVLFFLF